jgi:hypothetical protein
MVGYQDKSKINRDMGAQTGFILLRIVTSGKTSKLDNKHLVYLKFGEILPQLSEC